jgi:hypothetical protein
MCTKADRMLLVLLARAVRAWKQALFIVQPETLLRWHRCDETGRAILQLIRETKGTPDETRLQFPQEKRKINCARKYFKTLQLDYRHITDSTPGWWLPDDAQQQLLEM